MESLRSNAKANEERHEFGSVALSFWFHYRCSRYPLFKSNFEKKEKFWNYYGLAILQLEFGSVALVSPSMLFPVIPK